MGVSQATAPFSLTTGSITPTYLSFSTAEVLGSGRGSITGDGSRKEIGNFSTSGDIGKGSIIIHIFTNGDSNDDASTLYVANTSTGTTGFKVDNGALTNAICAGHCVLRKAGQTITNCDYYTSNYQSDYFGYNNNQSFFNLSAAEMIYINLNVGNTYVTYYTWIAYLINE